MLQKVIFYVGEILKKRQKSAISNTSCFYKKKQGNFTGKKVIFYVGKSLKMPVFWANSRDFLLKILDFLESHSILEPIFQLKFNFFYKIKSKMGKIQPKICNILRGKKQPKVINYVEEGIFNVEFGLF